MCGLVIWTVLYGVDLENIEELGFEYFNELGFENLESIPFQMDKSQPRSVIHSRFQDFKFLRISRFQVL